MSPKFNEGEIAITTNTKFRENLGKVVRLKEYLGRQRWSGLTEPEHVWWVVGCHADADGHANTFPPSDCHENARSATD